MLLKLYSTLFRRRDDDKVFTIQVVLQSGEVQLIAGSESEILRRLRILLRRKGSRLQPPPTPAPPISSFPRLYDPTS